MSENKIIHGDCMEGMAKMKDKEHRIHPTQKPVSLSDGVLARLA